jgi:hypothetical protein
VAVLPLPALVATKGASLSRLSFSIIWLKNTEQESGGSPASPDNIAGHFGGGQTLDDAQPIVQEIVKFDDYTNPVFDEKYVSSSTPSVYATESIKDWLMRPTLLTTGTWDSSQDVGDQLFTSDFPDSILTKPMFKNKIDHFRYFKADVRVSIRLNGLKTQYGKLIMTWSPYADPASEHYERTSNIFSLTGYPHVITSPTESEVVELVVPFVSPYGWYDRLSGSLAPREAYVSRPYGTIYLTVMNKLASTSGSNAVNYSIYANFVNVELDGYMIEEGDNFTAPRVFEPIKSAQPYGRSDIRTELVPQSGGSTTDLSKHPINKEAAAKSQSGTLSSLWNATKYTVGSLARGVGAAHTVVSAASQLVNSTQMASIASTVLRLVPFLGCKPDTLETTSPYVARYADTAHGSGLDTSVKLALSQENNVSGGLSFMGNLPVMEFANIVATPMLIHMQPWETTSSVGNLFVLPVSPLYVHSESFGSGSGLRTYFPTYLSHVANAFHHWKADLRYYVTITASAFHSGRLRVYFDPSDDNATSDSVEYSVSKIIDLQTEMDFSFTVPFMYRTPYCSTGTYRRPVSIGTIGFNVVNQLISTTAASSQVMINVFVSATNVQFGEPRQVPANKRIDTFKLRPQALTTLSETTADYDPIIPSNSMSSEGVCMGEQPVSVKELICRPGPFVRYRRTVFDPSTNGTLAVSQNYGITMNRTATQYFDDPIFPGPLPIGRWRVVVNMTYATRAARVHLSNSSNNTNLNYLCSTSRAGTTGGEPKAGNYHSFVIDTSEEYTYVIVSNLEEDNEIRFSIHFSREPDDEALAPPSTPPPDPPSFEQGRRQDVGIVVNVPLYSPYGDTQTDGVSVANFSISFMSYFSYIYRFWRGSVRYKMVGYRSSSISTLFASRLTYKPSDIDGNEPVEGGTTLNLSQDVDFNAGTQLAKTPVSNVLEVTWPYYNKHLCEVVGSETTFRTYPDGQYSGLAFGAIQESYAINDSLAGSVLHSAGDDFEFGFLVPPPFFLAAEVATSNLREMRARARNSENSHPH